MNTIDKPALTQFVRDRNGQPRGMVVATVIDNTICIGWSYTNVKAGDRFDKKKAFIIALGRAENGWSSTVMVPRRVYNVYKRISLRASTYFNISMTHIVFNNKFKNRSEEYAEQIDG